VPGEPYRIELPDGTIRTGTLDDRGKARIAGLAQGGTCQVCFYKRDAAIWSAGS
jgi:type VI secretion system secreted protein VgrG